MPVITRTLVCLVSGFLLVKKNFKNYQKDLIQRRKHKHNNYQAFKLKHHCRMSADKAERRELSYLKEGMTIK